MIIANKLRETNRAEYLLYLWQVEDILRIYGGDFDRLKAEYLVRFEVTAEQRKEMEQWYAELCDMMHQEGCCENGHLTISRHVLATLTDLHNRLIASPKFPYYREMYYKVLPYIVELRAKGGHKNEAELETCFDALYGVMMLRLQGKQISDKTAQAVADISKFLGQLSDYYFKDKAEPLDL